MSTRITAVVGGPAPARARCEQALASLSVDAVGDPAVAPDGLIWFLSSGGVPDAGTLELLLEARGAESAELVAGVPVDENGEVVRWLAPTARSCDTAEMYAMLARSRMPLMGAGADCLLVPRDLALPAFAGKSGRYGRLAARVAVGELLAAHRGVIEPRARVIIDTLGTERLGVRDVPAGLRAIRAGGAVPRDLLNMFAPGMR